MIGLKEVEHVAKLARLTLTDEEKSRYTEQLARIIDYVDQLREVDTNNVEPLAQTLPVLNVMREDEVYASCGREVLLQNAPESENGYFKVPKIGE